VECTKSKIIPKDTATALEHIKSNAQGLNDAVNDNSLKGYLDAAIKKWRTDKLKAVVAGAGNQVTAAKLAVGNARTYVQQAKDMVAKWPLPQNYLSTLGTDKLSKACRNMNNPLAALIKAVDAGATVNNFDLGKAKVLQPKVSPYADDQAGNYLKGKDQNAMNQIITTISGYVDEFASLVNNAAVAAL
jgi:hypothetical protein